MAEKTAQPPPKARVEDAEAAMDHVPGRTAGFTLIELLIALLIGAVIGIAMVQVFLSQSRFMSRDSMSREARASVVGGLGLIGSDLRMVEYSAGFSTGLVATGSEPSDSSFTVRLPQAFAITCNASTLVVPPYDTARLTFVGNAATRFDGYAVRAGNAGYTYYVVSGAWLTMPSSSTACATPAPAITTSGGGIGLRLASLASPLAPAPPRGTPVMLYVTARYRIGNSTSFTAPQRQALFITIGGLNTERELLAPLDTGAKFRYFDAASSDTARTSPPADATTIRGVQFILPGISPRIAQGRAGAEVSRVVTSIFFRNTP